jgi:hypothetical protein
VNLSGIPNGCHIRAVMFPSRASCAELEAGRPSAELKTPLLQRPAADRIRPHGRPCLMGSGRCYSNSPTLRRQPHWREAPPQGPGLHATTWSQHSRRPESRHEDPLQPFPFGTQPRSPGGHPVETRLSGSVDRRDIIRISDSISRSPPATAAGPHYRRNVQALERTSDQRAAHGMPFNASGCSSRMLTQA